MNRIRMSLKLRALNKVDVFSTKGEQICNSLAALGEEVYDPITHFLMERPDDNYRRLKWSSVVCGIGASVANRVAALLKNPNVSVRITAAETLRDMSVDIGVSELIHGLKDQDEYVRARCAEALGKTGNRGAIKPLSEVLTDPDVLGYAVVALGEIGTEDVIAPLMSVMRNNKVSWGLRVNACKDALLRAGNEKARELIISLTRDPNSDLYQCVKLLQKIGAAEEMVQLLNDEKTDDDLQGRTAYLLGEILYMIADQNARAKVLMGIKSYLKKVHGTICQGGLFASQTLISAGEKNDILYYLQESEVPNNDRQAEREKFRASLLEQIEMNS